MAQRILRPLSYGDLFDELFDLYKKNFLLFAGISAIVVLPLNVLIFALAGGQGNSLSGLVFWPANFIIMAASTLAVSECYLGRTPTILSSFKAIKGRSLRFIITMFATSMFIGCGFLLLVIPGIILSIWYFFVSEVFVLEGTYWGDARARSKELAAGHGWRILTIMMLSGLITVAITYAFIIPATMLLTSGQGSLSSGLPGMIYGLVMGVATALSTPIQVIASVLMYYDIRVRKEGFDVEMLAAGIAGIDNQAPAPQQA